MLDTRTIRSELQSTSRFVSTGHLIQATGPVLTAQLPGCSIGDWVEICEPTAGRQETAGLAPTLAQVTSFDTRGCHLAVLEHPVGLRAGSRVRSLLQQPHLYLSSALIGAVIDSLGKTLRPRGLGLSAELSALSPALVQMENAPPRPLARRPIIDRFETGLAAVDGFLTIGQGQRLCVLAEPGVGKSTLMGAVCAHSNADVNVVALIGERGWEVNQFLDETLSDTARRKTVLVISTSDETPLRRITAASTATRIAEYFRDAGLNVLLQMDSLTRLFRAMREIGLASGELPVRRGYPPSVFAALPSLIERTGNNEHGSITALYTLLLTSDIEQDPMIDEVKSLTDGHIVLSKELADRGHYPAIDILASISRLFTRLADEQLLEATQRIRSTLAKITRDRDLATLGNTIDASLQQALAVEPEILQLLQKKCSHTYDFGELQREIIALSQRCPR